MPQRFLRTLAIAASLALTPMVAAAAPSAIPALPAARNDYANAKFSTALAAGLKAFYTKQFGQAVDNFNDALAISFLNAAAAQNGTLE